MTKADVMEHWDDRRLREGEGEGEPKGLIHRALQASLETELTDRLGYERHAVEGQGRGTPATGLSQHGAHRDRRR